MHFLRLVSESKRNLIDDWSNATIDVIETRIACH